MKREIKTETESRIANFIVNELGINLCSVEDIIVDRVEDGQIKDINIKFIPSNEIN